MKRRERYREKKGRKREGESLRDVTVCREAQSYRERRSAIWIKMELHEERERERYREKR